MNHISHSTISAFSSCQKKAEFKFAGTPTKTSENMFLGSAIHYGLKTASEQLIGFSDYEKKIDIDGALAEVEHFVLTLGNIDKYDPSQADKQIDDYDLERTLDEITKHAQDVVATVLRSEPFALLKDYFIFLEVEERFDTIIPVTLPEERTPEETDEEYYERTTREIRATGKADLLLRDTKSKSIYVVDWKTTGGYLPKKIPMATKLQLCNYGLYYKSLEQFQDYEVFLAPFYIRTKADKNGCYDCGMLEFQLTEDMEEVVIPMIINSYFQLEQIEQGQPAFPSGLFSNFGKGDCDWCEYKEQCKDFQIMKGDET